MQNFAAYITLTDESGTYSEGAEFPASHWKDATELAIAKATDLARGDFQELHMLTARKDGSSDIASFTARCTADGVVSLVTITEL